MKVQAQCRGEGCTFTGFLEMGDWCGKCLDSRNVEIKFLALQIEYRQLRREIEKARKRIFEIDDEIVRLGV